MDLIVTDQRGNFVADLNPEEIEVFEDGKRQELQFFRLERTDRFHGKKTQSAVSDSTGAYYAFLVDLQTLTHETVQTSKAAIREFLRSKIDPRDYFMLAALGPELQVVQPFTRNLTVLEQALDRVYLDVVPKGGVLAVRARIPTNALRFVSEGEKNRCVLEIFGIVFDEFHEPTEKGFFLTKSVDLDFDAKGLETFLGYETIGPWMEEDFPEKGNYLVVVLRQRLTGELAAAQAVLDMNNIAH